jgi:tagaturonate epimerase
MSVLEQLPSLSLRPSSLVSSEGAEFGLALTAAGPRLSILADTDWPGWAAFQGDCSELTGKTLLLGSTSPHNAAALRAKFSWLRPQTLGLHTSAGLGDRLGLATPGHVRAMQAGGGAVAPIFPQQSIREMARTGRSPQQVMDEALWGIFQEGWHAGFGADADHLKTTADMDACLAAGYTFFTIDPGDHVDNGADTATLAGLRSAVAQLPPDLQPSKSGLQGKRFEVEGHTLEFDELTLWRAAAKYGRAVAHVTAMYRHLRQARDSQAAELEVSVDETATPTTPAEHVYLACELRRLGVDWVSLAPRYIGRFEKGVDYISPEGIVGETPAFATDFALHAAIARQFGPYKLSLHSGSDKFSLYPIAMRETCGLVHLKTAGTSYLEALRTIAPLDPAFFREIYTFAREKYEIDRATYNVSARLERAPVPQALADADLPRLLDQFDAREILHVTFGSVLTEGAAGGKRRFYDSLMGLLRLHAEAYAARLEAHFVRHLRPFSITTTGPIRR